jgi:hypothetical protein
METKLPLEKELEPIFLDKFPAFPDEVKEFLVKFGPYLLLVGALLGIFALIAAYGVVGGREIYGIGLTAYGGAGIQLWLGMAITLGVMVLYLLAFKPLRERKKQGWNLLYYALLLNLLSSLIQVKVFAVIFGAVIGFWVLFQIRDKYSSGIFK